MFECRKKEIHTGVVREKPHRFYNKRYEYRMNTDMNTAVGTSTDDTVIQRVLHFLIQYPKSTQKEISEKLEVTTRTVERTIATLKEQGYIKRTGNNRSGYWEIKKYNWRTR